MSRNQRKTILILSANPKDTTRLRIDEEPREIEEIFSQAYAHNRYSFEVETKLAVRVDDLLKAIVQYKPNYVHFCGHGRQSGVILEDAIGKAKEVSGGALLDLFEPYSDNIECVVFNVCRSASLAQEISNHIDYAIGMNEVIDDKDAIAFSKGFYRGIVEGTSIEEAFKLGCTSIRMNNPQGHQIPKLCKKIIRLDNPRNDFGLVPYMPDRDEQEASFRQFFYSHSMGDSSKNIVIFLHGDHEQCHDHFIERLRVKLLPELLCLNRDHANPTRINFNWPISYQSLEDLSKQIMYKLKDHVLYEPPFHFEKFVNTFNRENIDSLIISSFIHPKHLSKSGKRLLADYTEFWAKWPRRISGKPLIACLYTKYEAASGNKLSIFLNLLNKQYRPKEKVLDEVRKMLNSMDFKKFSNINGIVLPELNGISLEDVQSWVETKEVKEICGSHDLFSLVKSVYKNDSEKLPMNQVAIALNGILHEYKRNRRI